MKTPKLKIYLGWDSRAGIAYDVARFSILRRSSLPKTTQVFPLELEKLREQGVLTRPVERKDGNLWCPISEAPMATEFAISRFAVPLLARRKGWALFADCDIICYEDVAKLFALADPKFAVLVVKHQQPAVEAGVTKMDGQQQTNYHRKNWSSVVLWNCAHPSNAALTHEVLNTWPGRDLHAFKWLKDEEIGELPGGWNHLVDVQPPYHPERTPTGPKIAHLTLGGPWFKGWTHGQGSFDAAWLAEAKAMVITE